MLMQKGNYAGVPSCSNGEKKTKNIYSLSFFLSILCSHSGVCTPEKNHEWFSDQLASIQRRTPYTLIETNEKKMQTRKEAKSFAQPFWLYAALYAAS